MDDIQKALQANRNRRLNHFNLAIGNDFQKAESNNGKWVTINGTHVFIKNGKIEKGPDHMVGKAPSEVDNTQKQSKKTISDGVKEDSKKEVKKVDSLVGVNKGDSIKFDKKLFKNASTKLQGESSFSEKQPMLMHKLIKEGDTITIKGSYGKIERDEKGMITMKNRNHSVTAKVRKVGRSMVLDIQDVSDEVSKSEVDFLEKSEVGYFEKGKKADEGEIREWSGKKYKKTGGKWEEVKGDKKSKKEESTENKEKKEESTDSKKEFDPDSKEVKEAAQPLLNEIIRDIEDNYEGSFEEWAEYGSDTPTHDQEVMEKKLMKVTGNAENFHTVMARIHKRVSEYFNSEEY